MTEERPADSRPWTEEEFVSTLRAQGRRYHNLHPFHVRMDAGKLSREELQRWVANRFYYQKSIPIKDAAILSNCPEVEIRRAWVQRILDHDGQSDEKGGIEKWLRLGEALGVPRTEMSDERHVLPGVRFAVDAYVTFCRSRPWIEAVAASLTELFGPDAIRHRLVAIDRHYPWIDPAGLEYFRGRLRQAPRDAAYSLDLVVRRCRSREAQERAVGALAFKCDLLWSQLDAIERGDSHPVRGEPDRLTPDSTIPDSARPRLARGIRLQWDEVRGQTMLLFPEGALALNETAGGVLELCDGERTVAEIVVTLRERYPGANVDEDVRDLLERLQGRRLLVVDDDG